jgi:hypothetical protein
MSAWSWLSSSSETSGVQGLVHSRRFEEKVKLLYDYDAYLVQRFVVHGLRLLPTL